MFKPGKPLTGKSPGTLSYGTALNSFEDVEVLCKALDVATKFSILINYSGLSDVQLSLVEVVIHAL